VVSLVVKLRIASKFDARTVVEQHFEALPHAYALLQQACEESNKLQLSRNIEPSVTRLLRSLSELTTQLELYVDGVETDKSEGGDCETNFGSGAPCGFRWRKALQVGAELRQRLNCFTDLADEASHGGW
jgi:phage-related minor tail protein